MLIFLVCRPPGAAAVEFSSPVSYAAGINPVAMAVGDFNGDGKLDLAVVNQGDGTTTNPGNVSILLGKGDGTFQTAVEYAAGQSPNSIAVGDFNGDGKLDLAVANQGIALQAIDGSVSILLGKGDGTFEAPVDYAAGKIPSSIAAGDFNGDGKPDLAVVNVANSQTATQIDGNLSILLNVGDGTFQPAVDYQPCPSPISVQLADFNHDGKLDLIAQDQSTAATSGVLLGNGDGTFQPPLLFNTRGSVPLVLGDFNGDGKIDLAQTAGAYEDLYLANGDGTFQPAVMIPLAPPLFTYVALTVAADINDDGKLDLVGWSRSCVILGCNQSSNFSFILLGRGDGTFVHAPGSFELEVNLMVSADFNGDKLPDLAGIDESSGSVGILLNTTPTTAADLALTISRTPAAVAVGQNVTYTINVANEGPQDATGVTVTDMLPPQLTLVSATASQGNCGGTTSISCDLGSLASPGSAMVTITATVNAPGTANTITNQASVSATESDPNTANNSASAAITVPTTTADLALTISRTPAAVAVGQKVMYTINVANEGPQGATGVTVTDMLPPQLTLVSATPSQGTCQGTSSISCDLGSLASPGSAMVTITATVNAPGTANTITNQASVSATESDPNTANNSASAAITVPTTTADLALTISRTPAAVAVGQKVMYTINVANEGPQGATGVTVTDMLPPQLTLVSATASQGNCGGTTSISCDLGSLASPGSAMVTITATVNAPGTVNTITNQASVSATESDPNTANNSASASTTVEDFQLAVSVTSLTVAAGASASATVSLSPVNGFNQAATLACAGAPSNATCEISPGSVTLDGSNPADATLIIKATARSSALPFGGTNPFVFGRYLPISWAVLLMVLMLLARYTKDAWRRSAAHGLILAAMALLVVMWAACGGGGNNSTGPSVSPPPEVSTLTITATAGSFTQSTTVTLTIK